MQEIGIGICDRDREYVSGVMQYINSRRDLPLRCAAFTGMEKARAAMERKSLALLLTEDDILSSEDSRFIPLKSTPCTPEEGIFKYRSMPDLVHEIMRILIRYTDPDSIQARLTAVFSPVGRSGKTTFAKACAAEAAGGIYIGMEDFGMEESQLLYLLKNRSDSLERELPGYIRQEEGYDALYTEGLAFDIRCISGEDISYLAELLRRTGRYTSLIFDLGAAVPEMPEVFSRFDVIYMPVLEDSVSRGKIERFLQVLRDRGLTDVLLKLREVHLPADPAGIRREAEKNLREEAIFGDGSKGKVEENLSGETGPERRDPG